MARENNSYDRRIDKRRGRAGNSLAAIRAVVRTALGKGQKVKASEGYQDAHAVKRLLTCQPEMYPTPSARRHDSSDSALRRDAHRRRTAEGGGYL